MEGRKQKAESRTRARGPVRRGSAAAFRRGFTLAEGLIAATVLAVAVVGIAGVLAASYQQTTGQADTAAALAVARPLVEEIAARPFAVPGSTRPGWPTQTDRRQYDEVADYHGYTDTTAAMTTAGGIPLSVAATDGTAFTRTVTVTAGAVPSLPGAAPRPDDFLAVTVRVTGPRNLDVSITQVVARTNVVR
jgi:Tfp pilus assembly protein PilV